MNTTLRVRFSNEILIPENYTDFDHEVLKITVTPSAYSDYDYIHFKWQVINIT